MRSLDRRKSSLFLFLFVVGAGRDSGSGVVNPLLPIPPNAFHSLVFFSPAKKSNKIKKISEKLKKIKIKNEKIPRVHMSVPHQKIIKRKKLSNHSVKRAKKKKM